MSRRYVVSSEEHAWYVIDKADEANAVSFRTRKEARAYAVAKNKDNLSAEYLNLQRFNPEDNETTPPEG